MDQDTIKSPKWIGFITLCNLVLWVVELINEWLEKIGIFSGEISPTIMFIHFIFTYFLSTMIIAIFVHIKLQKYITKHNLTRLTYSTLSIILWMIGNIVFCIIVSYLYDNDMLFVQREQNNFSDGFKYAAFGMLNIIIFTGTFIVCDICRKIKKAILGSKIDSMDEKK